METKIKENVMGDWSRGVGKDIARILFTEKQIQDRVKDLGAKIVTDYGTRDVVLVGVLNGCFPFMADLVRSMNMHLEVDFIAVSSYGSGSRSTGIVRVLKDLSLDIENRHVLLVEDIVDTGLTSSDLVNNLQSRRAASVEICTLLDKREARKTEVALAYAGFECPNEFVVGYGLDYNQRYRNLPYIGVLKEGPAVS